MARSISLTNVFRPGGERCDGWEADKKCVVVSDGDSEIFIQGVRVPVSGEVVPDAVGGDTGKPEGSGDNEEIGELNAATSILEGDHLCARRHIILDVIKSDMG